MCLHVCMCGEVGRVIGGECACTSWTNFPYVYLQACIVMSATVCLKVSVHLWLFVITAVLVNSHTYIQQRLYVCAPLPRQQCDIYSAVSRLRNWEYMERHRKPSTDTKAMIPHLDDLHVTCYSSTSATCGQSILIIILHILYHTTKSGAIHCNNQRLHSWSERMFVVLYRPKGQDLFSKNLGMALCGEKVWEHCSYELPLNLSIGDNNLIYTYRFFTDTLYGAVKSKLVMFVGPARKKTSIGFNDESPIRSWRHWLHAVLTTQLHLYTWYIILHYRTTLQHCNLPP